MATYQQMGHDSGNLLDDENLTAFRGAVLSPVNETPDKMKKTIARRKSDASFEFIFDPQFYEPRSQRSSLPVWPYFSENTDTADESNPAWWAKVVDKIVETANDLDIQAVCSPASLPRVPDDAALAFHVQQGRALHQKLAGTGREAVQTAVVSLADVSRHGRALSVASTLSATPCDRIYIVFQGNTDPRFELANAEELKGAMRLIHELHKSDFRVIVSSSSSDELLWKLAGAESCAAGKFFNLRRFTPSRFGAQTSGGGNVWYFFEEELLAFLRQADFIRIMNEGMLGAASKQNPLTSIILDKMKKNAAWKGDSWRQFLYWFADFEARYDAGGVDVPKMIADAQQNWNSLQTKRPPIFMEEQKTNNGAWLSAWNDAVKNFRTY